MKREATVVEVDGRLMAEVVRTEACLQCHACQYGQKGRVLVELPEGDYRVGDTVELSLEDARFARASLVAYALPVATLEVPASLEALPDEVTVVGGEAIVHLK